MEDGGDQCFVDATQLAVNHALEDGAEASSFGHHLWVLQGCTGREKKSFFFLILLSSKLGVLQTSVRRHGNFLLPNSHTMAMAARTIRSLSCSPSVPTAIREFAIEVGNSIALTVIIYRGRERRDT